MVVDLGPQIPVPETEGNFFLIKAWILLKLFVNENNNKNNNNNENKNDILGASLY